MDLKEKLIKTPMREVAGGRTANRFAYQVYWALYKLLQLFQSEDDFALIMEFIDDVIVLDSSSEPKLIDFYQIKTNDKTSVQYISVSNITARKKKKEKEGMSFIEKLLDNMNRYPNETRSLHFVSNKFYNIKLKAEGVNSKEEWSIPLKNIAPEDIRKIQNNMCSSCIHKNSCVKKCQSILYFDVSEFDINTYTDAIFGKFVKFLIDKYGNGDIANTKAMFHTILSEIMRINNTEKKAADFTELISSKSITKDKFSSYLREFEKSFLMKDDWAEISSSLRSQQENYNNFNILRIKKQWDKYKLDILNADTPVISRIRGDIRTLILNKEFQTYRECIEYVHLKLSNEDYYINKLYPIEYFTAMILGEIYYG